MIDVALRPAPAVANWPAAFIRLDVDAAFINALEYSAPFDAEANMYMFTRFNEGSQVYQDAFKHVETRRYSFVPWMPGRHANIVLA